MPNKRLVQKT